MLENLTKISEGGVGLDLPSVRGKYAFDAIMAPLTWFRVGGATRVLFKPHDKDDLAHFLKNIKNDLPYFAIGAGSNVLIRDGGYDGAVIKLGKNFAGIAEEDGLLIAGAAALDRSVAMTALTLNLRGFEFLVTIPGSIGGAIAMNAGCYGREIKDILAWVECVNAKGETIRLYKNDLNMTYRKGHLPNGHIVTSAAFYAPKGDAAEIRREITEYTESREASQPTGCRTGGSTFKNPPSAKAWELIDKAGCRGVTVGGAKISEKHCNFMLNTGSASALDLENLGELVRNKVMANSNRELEWEIIRIGKK